MAYQHTHNIEHYKSFKRIFDYTFEKVGLYPGNKHKVKICLPNQLQFSLEGGEWAGYLNREGKVKMDFKGGPFKGCFHVPRALMICENMLKDLLK